MKRVNWILLACLLAWITGCLDSGLVEISGQVTLDGSPLRKGTIRFLPTAGSKGPSAGAIIQQGRYSVEVAPGPKKVEIVGYKKVGQQHVTPNDPNSPLTDINEQIVPERYNKKTELTYDAQRSDTLDFALLK